MDQLLMRDEVYAIMGAAMEVHSECGCGFLEAVYQEAMEIELATRGIPFRPQQDVPITYKGRRLNKCYVADVVCYGQIIIEIKALDRLSSREEAQLLNYLKASGLRVGLLTNFGAHDKLEWKRMVR